ncbi:MAG: hypothetical protein ACFFDI_15020 [Promethearchaeota archaeon]
MAEIEFWKLGIPALGAVILCIQNLLIIMLLFTMEERLEVWPFIFILDLIGFSILGVGCLLLAIDHSRIINPLLAGVAFFGWVGFSLLWRFMINFYTLTTPLSIYPEWITMGFFLLGAISLVIAFFFFWRSLSEYEGGRQFNLIGIIISIIYTVTNLIFAILAFLSTLGHPETNGANGGLEAFLAALVTGMLILLSVLFVKMLLIPILGIFNFVMVIFVLILMLKR